MRNKFELFFPPRLHTRARTYAHIYGGNPDAGINMVASRERRYLYWQQLRRDTYPPSVANGRNLFRPVSAGDLADFKFTGTVRIVGTAVMCARARARGHTYLDTRRQWAHGNVTRRRVNIHLNYSPPNAASEMIPRITERDALV